MASYLITGCSRGLGLELIKVLISSSSAAVGTIIATSRSPTPSPALQTQIDSSKNRAHYVQLDILDPTSIKAATEKCARILGKENGLDVLINNAGIQILEKDGATSMHALTETLNTNVVAVHNVSQAFIPLLRQGSLKKIVNVTSTLGSIGQREYSRQAPFPSYKISKAALNMLTIQYSMQLEKEGFTVFVVNPGWLKTDLGGSYADLEPEVGAKGVMDIVFEAEKEKDRSNARYRNLFVEGGGETYNGVDHLW